MEINNGILIIEIPYAGFGDHLFHSHLPRIAKETKAYDQVFISSKSYIRQQDHLDLIWKLNPYVDGFVEESGVSCDMQKIVDQAKNSKDSNLLDFVMLAYELEDNVRWHEPEIYYKPKFIEEYNKVIFDPNHFTFIGILNTNDLYNYFKKNNITYDAVMSLRGNKALFLSGINDVFIDAPNVYSLCDVIFSSKKILCFTSGTATLSAALNKPSMIFYGKKINPGFHHSKIHTYCYVDECLQSRLVRIIKYPFRMMKNLLRKLNIISE